MQAIAKKLLAGKQACIFGNPAVIGETLRPVILRHHLSMALPFTGIQLTYIYGPDSVMQSANYCYRHKSPFSGISSLL